MTATPILVIDQVSKQFQSGAQTVSALQAISVRMAAGEFVCLLGPSGSGKSTLLRIIGGLLPPDSGSITFQGRPLTEPQAEIGFVFQSTNLMPWRTVLDNVLLPHEVQQGKPTPAARQQAQALLALVGLQEFAQAYPHTLSGGMRQRVVLARTLLQRPQLLLMDEPFGALDALTRERLNLELLRLHEEQKLTTLMVTHSIQEAVFLADRVLVISERPGRLVADLPIPLARPRQLAMLGSAQFGQLTLAVRQWIGTPESV
ncbi:MAG: ABC transporter ATP-binding protein [Caldilineaceae bacterium]|nr:ABC transporter ATP-binding protein [Caldilineaceae bacterium]